MALDRSMRRRFSRKGRFSGRLEPSSAPGRRCRRRSTSHLPTTRRAKIVSPTRLASLIYSLMPQILAILVKQCVARAEHFDPKIARAVLLELRERLQSTSGTPVVLPVSVNIALANLGRLSGDHDSRIEALRQTIELCKPLPD